MSFEFEKSLEVSNLSVNYDEHVVLSQISLSVPVGVIAGIIGPNGAGKSTFIKAVLGLVKAQYDKILFFGSPLDKVKKRVAYVPQKESVDWNFPVSVKDLVLMGSYGRLGLFRRPNKVDIQRAEHYLEKVGMLAFADRQISQLSGGQQQRVFIARALMQEADTYFLDEPFTGIDIATENVIIDILKELVAQHKTIFIVHHDLNAVESYFNWIILLNRTLIASGKISEVYIPDNLVKLYGTSYALIADRIKS